MNGYIVELLDFWHVFDHFGIVLNLILSFGALTPNSSASRHWVVLQVDVSQFVTPFQVVQLIKVFDIVSLKIQYLEVLYETNIKQLVYLVVPYVELF